MKKFKISILCSLIIFCLMPVNIIATTANKIKPMVITNEYFTVGLTDEGKILIAGENSEKKQEIVDDLTGIVQISNTHTYLAALKSDGTVSVKMWNIEYDYGQSEAENWTDIVQISADLVYIVGLKSDGTVVSTKPPSAYDGGRWEVSDWKDIIQVSAGVITVGLKSDGTVVIAGEEGYGYDKYKAEMSTWTDITQIILDVPVIGIKSDGSIVTVWGWSTKIYEDFKDLYTWTDIVSVHINYYHAVGLKKDGSVVIDGLCRNEEGEPIRDQKSSICNEIKEWTDIISVTSARMDGEIHYVGLKSDGTVVLGGGDPYGACDGVEEWDLISEPPIGDLDGDKAVGITDIVAMAKFVHNRVPLTEETFAAADLNSDNTVNAIDLSIMKWLVVKGVDEEETQ